MTEEYLLTVDVGNTSTSFALFTFSGALRACGSFRSEIPVSVEDLLVKLKAFLDLYGIKIREIRGISLSSVVPPLTVFWVELGQKWLAREVLVASAETVPLEIDLWQPAEVGADRLVNAFAALVKYKKDSIVVDFGTATTFDCVSAQGVYLGGAIAPGLLSAVESLYTKTAKLPRIEITSPPSSPLGKDTISAMKSGILYGFACLTDGMVEKLKSYLSEETEIIATGGLAQVIAPLTKSLRKVEPLLLLEGLYLLWKRCYGLR